MNKKQTIAFIMNAFPVLSETFVAREVIGLRNRGLDLRVYSIFPAKINGANDEINSLINSTQYLLAGRQKIALLFAHLYFFALHPWRYVNTLAYSIKNREQTKLPLRSFFRNDRKSVSRSERQDMLLHFFLAVPMARLVEPCRPAILNAHFADAAASLTMLVSKLLNVPYGMTMHAYDIFSKQYNMKQKLDRAGFVFTCTKLNKDFLCQKFPHFNPGRVRVVYHGIELDRFKGKAADKGVPVLLSIGRLVPKKGLGDLIQAGAILSARNLSFQCRIIGDGPLRAVLEKEIGDNNLQGIVSLLGPVPHEDVLRHYKEARLFVLPSVVDESGDRDGIPNVIAEAMAMELPVVATNISAIPELVEDGVTGKLVPQHHPEELADALQQLLEQPEMAQAYGKAGRRKVKAVFDARKWLDRLADEYRAILREYQ